MDIKRILFTIKYSYYRLHLSTMASISFSIFSLLVLLMTTSASTVANKQRRVDGGRFGGSNHLRRRLHDENNIMCTFDTDVCGGQKAGTCLCDNENCDSWTCNCNIGYQLVDNTCEDVNECDLDPPICGYNHQCSNADGSYVCICQSGYYFNGATCAEIQDMEEGEIGRAHV